MARYPLDANCNEFAEKAEVLIGVKGWEGRLSRLWHSYRDDAAFAAKADSTRKLYTSRFRKALKDRVQGSYDAEKIDVILSYVDFEEGLIDKLRAEYNESVSGKSRELRGIPDHMALISVFQQMLEKDNARFKAIALMGLTGRRPIEILKTATFAPTAKEYGGQTVMLKYRLEFGGQAKTRGAEGTNAGKTYRIPCLGDAEKIIAALEYVRQSRDGQKWQEIGAGPEGEKRLNSAESGRMNAMLRDFLEAEGVDIGHLVLSDLRDIYAEISYHAFARKTETKSAYFARILGHQENDLVSSLSYMTFYLGKGRKSEAEARRVLIETQAAIKEQGSQSGADDDVLEDG